MFNKPGVMFECYVPVKLVKVRLDVAKRMWDFINASAAWRGAFKYVWHLLRLRGSLLEDVNPKGDDRKRLDRVCNCMTPWK